jgi:tetratricopeptide (TPR) repeat protein
MRLLQSIAVGLSIIALAGCATRNGHVDHLATAAPKAQLFDDMGPHTRAITTSSPEAQVYFDQGLNWMYAFNHDEAIRSFARAAELDPQCAMAWWGIAVCEGPNYNDPVMTPQRSAAAWSALQEARARIDDTTPVERDLIEALSARYAKPWPKDRAHLETAYADAMAEVWERYPSDSDVGALYAESLMVKRPWKLYTVDKEPEPDTPTIVATLERVMAMAPGNPGANHLYIHAVEPSRNLDRAIPAADRLSTQMPTAGHMDHMPSHIYVQTGMWDRSIRQNALAMEADDAYRDRSTDHGIQYMYQAHNGHMLAFSAMMVGREKEAMAAARSMWETIPAEVLEGVAPYVDLWMPSVYDVQKRFGRWNELLAEPAPPEYLQITTAIWRAHRAIAFAAKKDFPAAKREQELFRQAKAAIPEETVFGTDTAHRILEVSEHFIAGEIALQQGNWESAIAHLEKGAEVEDALWYAEPPQWLQPIRHTLGAVYLTAGRYADAERIYREDLAKWRGNGWSLYGLSRALAGQGKLAEAEEAMRQHEQAWSKADAATETSCLCIPEV